MEKNIKDQCNDLRAQCLEIEKLTRKMVDASVFKGEQAFSGQHSEMKANIMLSVRHLEDARMRLGKVIQAFEGGVSCYDKNPNMPYPG